MGKPWLVFYAVLALMSGVDLAVVGWSLPSSLGLAVGIVVLWLAWLRENLARDRRLREADRSGIIRAMSSPRGIEPGTIIVSAEQAAQISERVMAELDTYEPLVRPAPLFPFDEE